MLMLFAFLLISISLSPWAPVSYAAGFKVLADSSGIRIISEEPVYSIDNLAPGDSAAVDLEVVNESKESLSLAISADVEGGSEPLYEALSVVIIGKEEKYSGPLSGLQNINLGSFAAESTHSMSMTLTLPADAGNELQALSVSIKFHLYQVEDSEPPGLGGDDPSGPHEPLGPNQPERPQVDLTGDNKLPVTGIKVGMLMPLGLILFLIGLLILGSAKKEQTK